MRSTRATGQPAKDFGDGGRIDLREGLGSDPEGLTVQANSPGVVYRDMLILGMLTSEDLPSAPGFIRAFDVRTGKIRWAFRTIPQPGEFGYETWPKDAWTYTGGANSWPGLALDERRGLVFVPTGSAAFDFYGSNRAGDNLFANCLLALDAATGKRVWHFQFVRHDVWDRDLPAPPTLVQVRRNGKLIDAVAQITKSGHVWVFDRETGKSLFPFEDREVVAERCGWGVAREEAGAALAAEAVRSPAAYGRHADAANTRSASGRAGAFSQSPQRRTVRAAKLSGHDRFPWLRWRRRVGRPTWDPQTGFFTSIQTRWPGYCAWCRADASKGRDTGGSLYTRNCAGCHRADRKGTPPEFPSLAAIGETRTREQVTEVVRKGAGTDARFRATRRWRGECDRALHHDRRGSTGERRRSMPPHMKMSPLKYGIDGYNKFLDPDGYPAIAPPGEL